MSVLLREGKIGFGKQERSYKYAYFPCGCVIEMSTGRPNIAHCIPHWVKKDDPPLEQMIEACGILGLIPKGMPEEHYKNFIEGLDMPAQYRRISIQGRRLRNDLGG